MSCSNSLNRLNNSSTNTRREQNKYCAVKSCKYFHGTKEFGVEVHMFRYISKCFKIINVVRIIFYHFNLIHLFRFPKDEILSNEWKKAVGIDINTIVLGRICIEHFKKTHFQRNDKYHVILKPNVIPSVFPNQNELNENSSNNEVEIRLNKECLQCTQKDKSLADIQQKYQDQIKTIETKIITLKSSLKKARNRAYYLDSCNSKLNTAISHLKEDKIIDEKLSKAIEVSSNYFNIRSYCNS